MGSQAPRAPPDAYEANIGMPKKPKNESTISPNALKAIQEAWPHDIVEMPHPLDLDDEDEDRHLASVFEDLRDRLSAIEGASLMSERASDGTSPQDKPPPKPSFWDDDDAWLEGGFDEPEASYHLFFLGLTDPAVQFETESEEPVDYDDEDAGMHLVKGAGTVGCAIAVSLVAPVALIVPDQMEHYDDGSHSNPSIDVHIFDLDGTPMDMDDFIRNEHSQEAYDLICELRNEITDVLQSLGITVLPKDDAEKPAPWLKERLRQRLRRRPRSGPHRQAKPWR